MTLKKSDAIIANNIRKEVWMSRAELAVTLHILDRETEFMSSLGQMQALPAFQDALDTLRDSPPQIKVLFEYLRDKDNIIVIILLLSSVVVDDPPQLPQGYQGRMDKIRELWLQWGVAKGYLTM